MEEKVYPHEQAMRSARAVSQAKQGQWMQWEEVEERRVSWNGALVVWKYIKPVLSFKLPAMTTHLTAQTGADSRSQSSRATKTSQGSGGPMSSLEVLWTCHQNTVEGGCPHDDPNEACDLPLRSAEHRGGETIPSNPFAESYV